ncbi:N-acetylmuramic acid 6-phosphate etherase [Denitrobaculum tricleocarpae]|uniref:N-acetylmuramic acid 6-phosphate etherase n=1 Tax=Denitrobaculum tricleocarpae TaxID=2591009 RepID=A0A545U2H9_9PROT|nr:N-acetylmuramic acid 6-phosphate etherase [Denitrobaculum tricleocarpae]TQV83679.1 N-acetylmuramic acid 6-phosphate etherase [Denitrobaculum tricleocarpae]
MPLRRTEQVSDRYRGLDTWQDDAILTAMLQGQASAVATVQRALPALSAAASDIVGRYESGGRLIYAGAGSSGVIARLDALELPGTYGIPSERIVTLIAGGEESLRCLNNGAEDDREEARSAIEPLELTKQDSVIGISASGSTPYVLAVMEAARAASALTLGMACNADAPLLKLCMHEVLLDSEPEVVAGSTRMNAGTAQKCALNLLSTLVAIRLGHVYDGMMVNLRAENSKLKERATDIVTRASGVDALTAGQYLEETGGAVKPAILMGAGVRSARDADALLSSVKGNLRRALEVNAEETEGSVACRSGEETKEANKDQGKKEISHG